jgi:hypothetical protein
MRVHPGIDLQWDDMGSTEVLDRVRAERDNPQADVWFGAPAELFERAAREGLLEAYTPTWADAVPAEAHDSAGFWYGTYLTPEVIGYNSDAVTAAEAPRDWDDVLDPRWKGKLIIRDPVASGGMRAIFGAILERSVAATGTTAAGWNWLRRLRGERSPVHARQPPDLRRDPGAGARVRVRYRGRVQRRAHRYRAAHHTAGSRAGRWAAWGDGSEELAFPGTVGYRGACSRAHAGRAAWLGLGW